MQRHLRNDIPTTPNPTHEIRLDWPSPPTRLPLSKIEWYVEHRNKPSQKFQVRKPSRHETTQDESSSANYSPTTAINSAHTEIAHVNKGMVRCLLLEVLQYPLPQASLSLVERITAQRITIPTKDETCVTLPPSIDIHYHYTKFLHVCPGTTPCKLSIVLRLPLCW